MPWTGPRDAGRRAGPAMWHLVGHGRVLARHPDRRTCVVEAFERGLVWHIAVPDFDGDAPLPELVLGPGVEIVPAGAR